MSIRTAVRNLAWALCFMALRPEPVRANDQADILCKDVPEILASTEIVRKLKAQRSVTCRAVDEAQFRSLLEEQMARDLEPPRNEAEGRLFELLRVLPAGFPYLRCIQELYNHQTAAFFRPTQHEFILPTWTRSTEGTIVHELTHALQHQTFNLEHFIPPKRLTSDEFLARVAVVEGDAVVTEELHRKLSNLTPTLSPPTAHHHNSHGHPDLHTDRPSECDLPGLFSEIFHFPYDAGSTFIRHIHQRGGVPAVNRLYDQPPRTTSEILHPERFPRRLPLAADRNTLLKRLPPESCRSCALSFDDRVGELGIRALLASKIQREQASSATKGWEDDWIQFWEGATQREALWLMQLATATDAIDLASAWSAALQRDTGVTAAAEDSVTRWVLQGQERTTYYGTVDGRTFTLRIVSNQPPR